MKVLKITFVLIILIFSSLNSSTSELQNVSNNITVNGSFASTVTINPFENNSNGLYDGLNVDINANVLSTSNYQFFVNMYDNITKAWLMSENNYYYPSFSGIMNFMVTFDGVKIYDLNMNDYVELRLNVYEYDNNGTYIGTFTEELSYYYISSVLYEKPPLVITVDAINFLDIETGAYVTTATGTADFIEVQFTAELTKPGDFSVYGNIDVYMNGSYLESLNYMSYDIFNTTAGVYSGSLNYSAYGLQEYNSILTFNINIYGSYLYDYNSYYTPSNTTVITALSGIFEKELFVLNSVSINFLDIDTGFYVSSPTYSADFIEITYDVTVNKPGFFELFSTINVYVAGYYMEFLDSFDNFSMNVTSAGNFTGTSLVYAAGLQSYYAYLDLNVESQGSFFIQDGTSYYLQPYPTWFYNVSSDIFESIYYTLTYNTLYPVDLDGNGLIDHYNIDLTLYAYRDIYFSYSLTLNVYDINNMSYSASSYAYDQYYNSGIYYLNISVSTSFFDQGYYQSNIDLYIDEYLYFNNNTSNTYYNFQFFNFYIGTNQYDNPEVYIRPYDVYIAPVNVPDSQMKDYLIFNTTIEVKEFGNLDVYLDIKTETDYFVGSYFYNMMNIAPGIYNIGFIIGGDILHNSFSDGNFTFTIGASLNTGTNYYDDQISIGYFINYMDWNQNYPNPPNADPSDPPSDDPSDPSDTASDDPTADDTSTNNNESDTSTDDVPTLDLPAPSFYISLLSLFSVIVLIRKRRV